MNAESKSEQKQWVLSHRGIDVSKLALNESLFAVGNGYIGVRGYPMGLKVDTTDTDRSTYLNGVYETLPIEYDESAYGFAQNCDRILAVPTFEMRIFIDGVLLDLSNCDPKSFYQELDLREGIYRESYSLKVDEVNSIDFAVERLVSIEEKHLVLSRVVVGSRGYRGQISICFDLVSNPGSSHVSNDPREGGRVPDANWKQEYARTENQCLEFKHTARNSGISVLSTMMCHSTSTLPEHQSQSQECLTKAYDVAFSSDSEFSFTIALSYSDSKSSTQPLSLERSNQEACLRALELGFEHFANRQRNVLDEFWATSDVHIVGDEFAQLSSRFCSFHLLQSTGRDGHASIAAKGITGAGYDGHYFWDSEIYVFPFWLFTFPDKAKNLLQYRVSTLEKAKERGKQMGMESGALFAWRTIGGEECSSYFPAGTAQYHINADIAYAVRSYYRVTGDSKSLFDGFAELVWETARTWMHIGHFVENPEMEFRICEVTGPDEYTAMVDNNYFTNSMAKEHLLWAFELIQILREINHETCEELMSKIRLDNEEAERWRAAGEAMYLPIDYDAEIIEQCDGFFAKPEWNFDTTTPDQYPLLLNFHPLNLYRHQVLKQADGVLAMLLNDGDLSTAIRKNTFDYYESRTTHDSTLSHCVHSILAAELGDVAMATDYANQTFGIDLLNKHKNTHYGVHTAAMGGVWMIATMGFAGLRYSSGVLKFKPLLPEDWEKLAFNLRISENTLRIDIQKSEVTYRLLEGSGPLKFLHRDTECLLDDKQTISRFSND